MEKYDSLRLKNQICFPLYACSRLIINSYREPLREINLTYPQYITMMVLWEERSVTAGELGRRLYLDSGTLTPLLKNLEAKGLITRKRSSGDERVLVIETTDEGERLRDTALGIPERVSSCIRLSSEESKALYGLLYKLLSCRR